MMPVKHIFSRLGKLLLLLVVVYFLCRLVFVVTNYYELNAPSIKQILLLSFYGLRFDVAAILITNGLFIVLWLLPIPLQQKAWYKSLLKVLFILFNSLFILFNISDIAYFPFIKKRMQGDALMFLSGKKGTEFYTMLPTFLRNYWYLILVYVGVLWMLIKQYKKIFNASAPTVAISFKNIFISLLGFVVGVALCIVGIRGGLQMKPLSIINAAEMSSAQDAPIVLNTPYCMINTFEQKRLPEVAYFEPSTINIAYSGLHPSVDTAVFKPKNVVVIIVESLSKRYLSAYGSKARTPFIDSLLQQSLVFTNAFANAKESIQGIPAILSSIPSWQDEPFIYSPYATNKITSLANVLSPKGYATAFFHGGKNGTMGFDAYSKLAGFDKYYGKNEYNNDADYDGDWGIWDEPFLQFSAQKMKAMPQPFATAIFTLNTHHPFQIPEKYKNKFATYKPPIYTCVEYADYALQQFFATAKKMPWFNNTIFVLTADHASPKFDEDKNAVLDDEYRIPIAFYMPNGYAKKTEETIASQIDIMPTLLHLLGYKDAFFSMGKNLLQPNINKGFAINYNAGVYEYIDSSYCYQFNGTKGIALYNWKQDVFNKQNLLLTQPSIAASADSVLKQHIQVFNHSMLHNKMFVGKY